MSDIQNRVVNGASIFPEVLVPNLVNLVRGHSALAKLCGASPIAFNGQREFTFSMDREVDIVAESGAKTKGGITVAPVTIIPIKFEYGARVSDEFRYGSDEVRLQYLTAFAEGFANKLARGLDIAAFHGVNPRTGSASAVVGGNNFDTAVTAKTTYVDATPDPEGNLETAVAALRALEKDVTGVVMAPAFASALAQLKVNGVPQYPEFRFGQNPDAFAGMGSDVNVTVSAASSKDRAIVGDFAGAFRWGYAKEIPLEVIEYGNPDNDATLGDLKGHNQVYLRAEAYLGWGILDAAAFHRIAIA